MILSSPIDQRATSAAPTIPIMGSSQFHPRYFPAEQSDDGQERRQRVSHYV